MFLTQWRRHRAIPLLMIEQTSKEEEGARWKIECSPRKTERKKKRMPVKWSLAKFRRERERERESKRGHNLRLATCVLLDPVARSYRFARCLTLYSPMARHARVCTCTCTTTRRPTTTETQFNNSVSPARKWLAQLVRRVRVKFPRNFAQCDEPFDFRGHPFTGYLVSRVRNTLETPREGSVD